MARKTPKVLRKLRGRRFAVAGAGGGAGNLPYRLQFQLWHIARSAGAVKRASRYLSLDENALAAAAIGFTVSQL